MSKYREAISKKLEETASIAHQIGCWRTIVFFESPITQTLEYRLVYTEGQTDAIHFAVEMDKVYHDLKVSYYVFSTAYNCNYDGGLLHV